ncbi:hypothetical protein C6P45_000391 [Maudiozyma exigua]|uniref:Rhodanese domain-containing protein n=1 Tax=Maudiozyma exigua TaxID=34358 RepID=A0A9P6WEQ8_MAUEX|nr:hypothetical protein C6P45_000391 [Kazachstania exigua]
MMLSRSITPITWRLSVRPLSTSSQLFNNVFKSYKFKDIKELIEEPNSKKVLVDVREPEEHMEYAIPNSINLPVNTAPGALGLIAEEFKSLFKYDKPDLTKELIFYCKSGTRAKVAEELARSYGYQNTGIYEGSINDWLKKNGKNVRSPN